MKLFGRSVKVSSLVGLRRERVLDGSTKVLLSVISGRCNLSILSVGLTNYRSCSRGS